MMKHFVSFKGIADLEEKLRALGLQGKAFKNIFSNYKQVIAKISELF